MLDWLTGLRSSEAVSKVIQEIQNAAQSHEQIRLMHLCGTHEQAMNRYALRSLLPANIEILAGPGCPVCVCPAGAVDAAVELSLKEEITLLTFGDMLKVPGSKGSLAEAKVKGAKVQILYSPLDAIQLAEQNPQQNFVFFAVGFETTAAGIASMITAGLPSNLFLLTSCRYMPPALRFMMKRKSKDLQGFILPGHAAVITGLPPYQFMDTEFKTPAAITGFEPLDLLLGILDLIQQLQSGKHEVKNLYPRAVSDKGNLYAQKSLGEAFDLVDGYWRGIGQIHNSAFELKPEFTAHDAIKRFQLHLAEPEAALEAAQPKACICDLVLLGKGSPKSCIHFAKSCTPENPIGPCMVSEEGTCNSCYRYAVE